jgi:hypothetical protein
MMVDLLVEHGVSVNTPSSSNLNNSSSLCLTIRQGFIDAAISLINCGADVNQRHSDEYPLMLSFKILHKGYHPVIELIELLFSKNVDCVSVNNTSACSLMKYAIDVCKYTNVYNFVDMILSRGYVPVYDDFCYAAKMKNVNFFISMFCVDYLMYSHVFVPEFPKYLYDFIILCNGYGMQPIIDFLVCIRQGTKNIKYEYYPNIQKFEKIIDSIDPDYPTLFDILYANVQVIERRNELFPIYKS